MMVFARDLIGPAKVHDEVRPMSVSDDLPNSCAIVRAAALSSTAVRTT